MTKQELSNFRRILESNVVELDHSSRRRDGILIEDTADELDRKVGANQRDLAVRNLQVVSIRQRETRAALGRVEEGTYGICLECEERISPKRLAALPWASLCLRCQQASDCEQPIAA